MALNKTWGICFITRIEIDKKGYVIRLCGFDLDKGDRVFATRIVRMVGTFVW